MSDCAQFVLASIDWYRAESVFVVVLGVLAREELYLGIATSLLWFLGLLCIAFLFRIG